jgi:hypothetical protein
MPEFATVSIKEAQLRTAAGRGGRIITEYVDFIQSLPQGQAGRLRVGEQENPLTIRRRLVTAAKALEVPLIIKRSGENIYFWKETGEEEPRRRRGRRPRRQEEETVAPKQPMIEPEFPASGNSDELVPRIEPDLPSSPL